MRPDGHTTWLLAYVYKTQHSCPILLLTNQPSDWTARQAMRAFPSSEVPLSGLTRTQAIRYLQISADIFSITHLVGEDHETLGGRAKVHQRLRTPAFRHRDKSATDSR
jgi:hypothetical protein